VACAWYVTVSIRDLFPVRKVELPLGVALPRTSFPSFAQGGLDPPLQATITSGCGSALSSFITFPRVASNRAVDGASLVRSFLFLLSVFSEKGYGSTG